MFKTPAGQARYFAAYDATLALWSVPVEALDLPTRFGPTHINACGPTDAPPLLLLPGQAISSTILTNCDLNRCTWPAYPMALLSRSGWPSLRQNG